MQRLALALALVLSACTSETDSGPRLVDQLPGELEEGRWNTIEPGGDTVCARGTPFRFYVWPGRADRLVVDFFGGGACWDANTCGIGGTFSEEVQPAPTPGEAEGLFAMTDPRNPVRDWTHVLIPYCTGDVHWGDATQSYGSALTIEHRGAVNVRSVLAWLQPRIPAPSQVLTTGCSAGGYGVVPWAAELMTRYPGARHVAFADAAAGIITPTFFQESFPAWNAVPSFPAVGGLMPAQGTSLPEFYVPYANAFPGSVWAQYTAERDMTQVFFWVAMGGSRDAGLGLEETWALRMRESTGRIVAGAPANYRYYIGGDDPATAGADEGIVHCTIPREEFFTRRTQGVTPAAFLEGLLEGRETASVACDGCEPVAP